MTQQAEIIRDINSLPQKYIGEVLNFIAFLRYKAQQEEIVKKEEHKEVSKEWMDNLKVFPNKNMTKEEEIKWINENAEWLNKEAEETLKYQVDIFEMGDPVE